VEHLLEAVSDGVATLTLNHPERLNALSTPIMNGSLEALPRLARGLGRWSDRTDGCRACVLRGRRRAWPREELSAACKRP
jgi:enoyl-CoA hydratase/carnithine racemase